MFEEWNLVCCSLTCLHTTNASYSTVTDVTFNFIFIAYIMPSSSPFWIYHLILLLFFLLRNLVGRQVSIVSRKVDMFWEFVTRNYIAIRLNVICVQWDMLNQVTGLSDMHVFIVICKVYPSLDWYLLSLLQSWSISRKSMPVLIDIWKAYPSLKIDIC